MTLEQSSRNVLLEKFNETRARTLELVKTLEKDDFGVQTAFYTSPVKWHLGHVSWLNEIVLSKTTNNYEFYSDEFSEYLNSYYNQFGKPHDKAKRGIMSRPTADEILQYFEILHKKYVIQCKHHYQMRHLIFSQWQFTMNANIKNY